MQARSSHWATATGTTMMITTTTTIMTMTVGRGVSVLVLKTEPVAVAAAAAEATEAAAVATVKADNNQQRAKKTVVVAIEGSKRHQAREEKGRWQQGWWGGAAAAAMASGERSEVRGSGSMDHVKKLTPKRMSGGRESMFLFRCPRVAQGLDTQRENIVSCTLARPQNIPFGGQKSYVLIFMFSQMCLWTRVTGTGRGSRMYPNIWGSQVYPSGRGSRVYPNGWSSRARLVRAGGVLGLCATCSRFGLCSIK